MLKPLRKTRTENLDVRQLQDAVDEVLKDVINNPLLQGRLIEKVVLSAGTNTLAHGLGRELRGYLIAKRSSAATVYQIDPPTPDYLTLVVSADVTLTLWVF